MIPYGELMGVCREVDVREEVVPLRRLPWRTFAVRRAAHTAALRWFQGIALVRFFIAAFRLPSASKNIGVHKGSDPVRVYFDRVFRLLC